MKFTKHTIWSVALAVALVLPAGVANAQDNIGEIAERGFYATDPEIQRGTANHNVETCKGEVGLVLDAADEGVHITPAIFGTLPGGGEGGQFDPTPVLSIAGFTLKEGDCINAHFSAIVGSALTYGVAPLALFQVSLTSTDGFGPLAMFGHFRTPYGIPSPAIAIEAETDVDMIAGNFFHRVGYGENEVPPGVYTADVWWSGAPPFVPGGAIGAAFVLKLYLRG